MLSLPLPITIRLHDFSEAIKIANEKKSSISNPLKIEHRGGNYYFFFSWLTQTEKVSEASSKNSGCVQVEWYMDFTNPMGLKKYLETMCFLFRKCFLETNIFSWQIVCHCSSCRKTKRGFLWSHSEQNIHNGSWDPKNNKIYTNKVMLTVTTSKMSFKKRTVITLKGGCYCFIQKSYESRFALTWCYVAYANFLSLLYYCQEKRNYSLLGQNFNSKLISKS